MGIEVACFGHGWPAGPVAADKIPEIMRDSVISLNFANSKGVNQIKARTFEVPGAGGFLLTEQAPGLDKWYTPGKEIEVFSNLEELRDKIRHYLSMPEQRDEIAARGFERTRSEHTYEARLKEIVDFTLNAHVQFNRAPPSKLAADSFARAEERYRIGWMLRFLRAALVVPCVAIWGKRRGRRAARRILFEISWRLCGRKTYSASGWPGRLFYEES